MFIHFRPFDPKHIEIFPATSVHIVTKRRAYFQIDGEYRGKIREITAEIWPGKLRVVLPEPAHGLNREPVDYTSYSPKPAQLLNPAGSRSFRRVSLGHRSTQNQTTMANVKTVLDEWAVKDLEDGSSLRIAVVGCTELGNESRPGIQVSLHGAHHQLRATVC
jgi:hypothetical protein